MGTRPTAGAGLRAALLYMTLKSQLRTEMQMAKECGFLAEARSKDESFLCLPIAARQFLPPAGQSGNWPIREDSMKGVSLSLKKKGDKRVNLFPPCASLRCEMIRYARK